MAQTVKNPSATQEVQETQVQSLDWEDPMDEEMATHTSIFTWMIQQTEEPVGVQSTRKQRVGHD